MFRHTDGNVLQAHSLITDTGEVAGHSVTSQGAVGGKVDKDQTNNWQLVLSSFCTSLERIFYQLLCSELLPWVLRFLCKLYCAASCAQQLVTPSGAVGPERKRRPEFDVVPSERTCQIKSVSGSRQAKWSVRLDLKRYASSVSHRW